MGLLAQASVAEIRKGLEALPSAWLKYDELRRPEIGLVMLRGRMGGDGAPFNLGEATATRASVRLASGETGHSVILGRSAVKAKLAALTDALFQHAEARPMIEQELLAPVRERLSAEAKRHAEQTAATKVDFFTMVRGED